MKVSRIYSFFILIGLLNLFPLFGLEQNGVTVISFGAGNEQIGVEDSEGELWKPLFFSRDTEGNFVIPDFYKSRIAFFSPQGKLVKAIQVGPAISPRMNFFTWTGNEYISFTDGILYCTEPTGKIRWEYRFGYGAFFQSIIASSKGLFLLPAGDLDKTGGYIFFRLDQGHPSGQFRKMLGSRTIPLILVTDEVFASIRIDLMRLFAGDTWAEGVPADAQLLQVLQDGKTVWHRPGETMQELYLCSDKGAVLKQGVLHYAVIGGGSGLWTWVTEQEVCKAWFYQDRMEIAQYTW